MNALAKTTTTPGIASVEEILDEARAGRMFILVDDEDRENEGDLVIPAQMVTPDVINFMARYGRGLICLAMTRQRIDHLGLELMSPNNGTRHETAFTVSIEAREGVTTGISAADRAHTIQVAIDPQKGPQDIVTPGHVFPLIARDGGVLVRAGHTEASVDIARLAGLAPAGVICEIMKDDGTMARLPDLLDFAQTHQMKIGTIADLIAWRRRTEKLVERVLETDFTSQFGGDFRMVIYANQVEYAEHVALVKGDITDGTPVMVRMHALDVLDDMLGFGAASDDLHQSMRQIGAAGRGVIVLLREPQTNTLSQRVKKRLGPQQAGLSSSELRDYGVGAQILIDLGVKQMILLSNSQRHIIGLEGYDLTIIERRPITERK